MKEKILITGGSGLLALNWAVTISGRFDVTLGLYDRLINLQDADAMFIKLHPESSFFESLSVLKPRIVIHTAGLTNIEICEKKPDEARHVNAGLSGTVAKVCHKLGIKLIHISTDHLFSGQEKYMTEEHAINPQNVYARTKGEAESLVLESCPSALIVRTNFFGWGPGYRSSFSDIIINTLRNGKELHLFHDVFYTPILAQTLAETVHELIEKGAEGIYNVAGNERITKYEFGLRVSKKIGLNSELIKPVSMIEKKDLVQRPYDLSLSVNKASMKLGKKIGNIDDDIDRLYTLENTPKIKQIREL